MSYFDFINQGSVYPQQSHKKNTTTNNIPVFIADELFAAQSSNSSPPATHSPHLKNVSASVNVNNSKAVITSGSNRSPITSRTTSKAASIKDTKRGSLQQNVNSMSSTSVFDFINQSSKVDLTPLDDLVFASSARSTDSDTSSSPLLSLDQPIQQTLTLFTSSINSPVSSKGQKTTEAQRLFEETNWKRARADRQHQQDLIQQLYEQRNITLNEIRSVCESIRSNSTAKQLAIQNEDYHKVDSLDKQGRLLTLKRDKLMYDVLESISQHIQAAWKTMVEKTQVVGNYASTVAHIYQVYKDERCHQFKKYNLDMTKKHKHLADEIKGERSLIETSKSELAFDMDYWNQAKSELDQKMAETVNDKQTQKEELVVMVHETDDEIQTLIKKLEKLKQTRASYIREIENLDHSMEQDLSYYQPEVNSQKKERLEIEARKKSLEQQSAALDQKEGSLQQKMEQNNQYEYRERNEFKDLDKVILEATTESQSMKGEADSILTVMNDCIIKRDQAITKQTLLLKKLIEDTQILQADIDQQEQEYNKAQQQMDEIDTRMNLEKLQKKKLEQWKSKSVEQGQYRQAGKWQEEMKQLDTALEQDQGIYSDYGMRIHLLDTNLATSRKALQGLRMDLGTEERKLAELSLALLKDSEQTIGQYRGSARIIDEELDSIISNWIPHYEQ